MCELKVWELTVGGPSRLPRSWVLLNLLKYNIIIQCVVCVFISLSLYLSLSLYIYIYVYLHICIYVGVCVYIYIYIYIYIYGSTEQTDSKTYRRLPKHQVPLNVDDAVTSSTIIVRSHSSLLDRTFRFSWVGYNPLLRLCKILRSVLVIPLQTSSNTGTRHVACFGNEGLLLKG